MTTLSAHSFLPDYEDLTQDFDFTQHLIPPSTHPQYQDCSNAYKQYDRALLLHILNPHTIPQDKAPTAFQVVQENSLQKDGFCLFFKITVALSPQLGGDYRDLQYYVESLSVSDGEHVLDFYLRALTMMREIKLQNDSTGQGNRLIRRFIILLFNVKPFTECLR